MAGTLKHAIAAPVVVVPACALLARAWLGVRYTPMAMCLDVAFLLPVSAGIALAVRRAWQVWVAIACLGLLLVIGHAWKLAMLGAPLQPGDLVEGIALLQVLSGWRLLLAAILLCTWSVALAVSLRPATLRRAAWLAMPLCWIAILLLFPGPFDRALRHDDVGHPSDAELLLAQGGAATLVRAGAEAERELGTVPTREEVAGALQHLGIAAAGEAPESGAGRPVHVVLLEALWDVRQLDGYTFSADPFDPAFRAAWEAGDNSTVLVPTFGGATANAEFEFLCGLPALRASVVFEVAVRAPVPCLPRVMREAGYESVAIHPNRADYWNRDVAYPRLGFESYRAMNAFLRDDMDGAFLSDASMFRQVREWADDDPGKRPRFTWLVSLGSHYPYDRDEDVRASVVSVSPAAPLLEAYANAIRYTTAAFMDYAAAVLAREPDALIVAFGDHAPVLGTRPDPYASAASGDADRMRATTPLLVIDGRRGPRPMGSLPLHQLAPRLLQLLGPAHPVLPHARASRPDAPEMRTRLFLNHLLWRGEDGQWRQCEEARGGCGEAEATRARLSVLRDDLTRGKQHSLRLLHATRYARPLAMEVVRDHPACMMAVERWGPIESTEGQPFNVQADGSSAFWFAVARARGKPRLGIAGREAPITIAGDSASASIDGATLPVGSWPLTWSCPDGSSGEIGSLTVLPAPGRPG